MSSEFRRLTEYLSEDSRRTFRWEVEAEGNAPRHRLTLLFREDRFADSQPYDILGEGEGTTFELALSHLLGRLAWKGAI